MFGTIQADYKLVLNALGVGVFAALMWMAREPAPHGHPAHAHQWFRA